MTNHLALDPRRSVVVEACAGSGKTWLLVSRIVRQLLDGAQPSQILAITFTRKAAQEMQARLQQWLHELATGDAAFVRGFLAQRGLENASEEQVQRARGLYQAVLLAQPGVSISTFHAWFMQVLQRAPLNAGVMQGMTLLERPGAEQEEAWEELLEQMRRQPEGELARRMLWLFEECGLFSTRKLLFNFLAKRAEWWAYTLGQEDALAFALKRLRHDLDVDMQFDPVEDWGMCGISEESLFAFIHYLGRDGSDAQKAMAGELERAWTDTAPEMRFDVVWPMVFTLAGEPRKLKATKKQDEAKFSKVLSLLHENMRLVRDILADQQAYRLNEAVLHCGVALLERYQSLKRQKQQMDFSDLEWQLCRLLQAGEHAETMQYKLDSRYRHVLLDEFQDTNPLQWQIMRAWFDAAVAVQSQPTVFIVGDPKQSIYRFRRADARLFGVARDFLKENFAAATQGNSLTRRNALPIVDAVNAVFREQPEGFEFVKHQTHQTGLPGHVLVLPLQQAEEDPPPSPQPLVLKLRDPLTTPREEAGEGARHKEAAQFAELLQSITRDWSVNAAGVTRRAEWHDIMVLVRTRTHLAIYEEALRSKHIPFISSRRGGLLGTLEAEDVQALLMFLITPFADLQLAQVLRTPIFACSDEDLMRFAQNSAEFGVLSGEDGAKGSAQYSALSTRPSWWSRLQNLDEPSPILLRARELLKDWLALADKLPVHDLLDRIYFEGDVVARYSAVLPPERRAKVVANLHAFMEIALSVDAGRYPSLPRFLQELRELRSSEDDAPDEGRLGTAGDAVRIYTVHEAKGLEAPIVWLLDANAEKKNQDGSDVLLAWSPHDERPAHFSVYGNLASRGKRRAMLFEQDAAQQAREEMNLLYVAMTRAQQALIVSGSQGARESRKPTWYARIAAASGERLNPLSAIPHPPGTGQAATCQLAGMADGLGVPSGGQGRRGEGENVALPVSLPTGKRVARDTRQQQRGIWLHALLQHLAQVSPGPHAEVGAASAREKENLRHLISIPAEEFDSLWQHAHELLASPQLERFFDPVQHHAAYNEMPYIDARGELKRIDRLVEFDDEVWVLDYKLGDAEEAERHRAQMEEYRAAMQAAYAAKTVRCALVFAGGVMVEM